MPRVNFKLYNEANECKDILYHSINFLYKANESNYHMYKLYNDKIALQLYFDNKDRIDSLKAIRDELNSIINTIMQNHFVLSDKDYTKLINIINKKGEYNYYE